MQIKIPNLGDVDEVEVIEIVAAVGDEVGEDDTLIVIESDKASMDVPAGVAGKITEITVSEGDTVSEGSVIAEIETSDEGGEDSGDEDGSEEDSSDEERKGDEQDSGDNTDDSEDQDDDKDSQDEELTEAADTESTGEEEEIDILVPDIGDASGVVVIEVSVKAGDTLDKDDLVVVLESDKASMEVTAEHAGEIVEVFVSEDDEVDTGTRLARMKVAGSKEKKSSEADDEETSDDKSSSDKKTADKGDAKDDKQSDTSADKDGDGKTASADTDRRDSKQDVSTEANAGAAEEEATSAAKVYAGPATRRLARELGVDLTQVKGSGPRDRIVKDDVKAFVKQRMTSKAPAEAGGGLPKVPSVDFSRFGDIEEVELSRIRQRGAGNLHRSWVNLPHVTQHDEVDVTDLEAFRSSLKSEAEKREVRLTPLAFIIRACCRVLSEFPEFNSSLADDHKHLILKKYINIGMAVDTPEGLVVPVIRGADEKDVWALSEDIQTLGQKARDKKLGMDDLSGGTFSVSSLGALGGTGFTPIVNAPEVAILGVARLQTKPVWNGSDFEPRKVLPLSLSYDHRVINGADGGRFMVRLTELLGDYRLMGL